MNGALEHGFEISSWLAGLIITLIGVIYLDMRKQIGISLEELRDQIENNSLAVQENTKSNSDLTSKIAVMSERMESTRREHSVSIDSINTTLKEHDYRHHNVRDRLHALSNLINQALGILQMKGYSIDFSDNRPNHPGKQNQP